MMFWLLACQMSPYPEYWPDKSAYPEIESLEPREVDGRMGGERITLKGNRLETSTTVVVGGRNAEIVDVGGQSIAFVMPELPPGPAQVDVSVVTQEGASTHKNALTVHSAASDFSENEVASVSLLRFDCPIEGWGVYPDGEEAPMVWCGADMGYASAEGWIGTGSQAGYASAIAGLGSLAELPAMGEVRIFGPQDPAPPKLSLSYRVHGPNQSIGLETDRDFSADLSFVSERRELLEATYYWTDSISSWNEPQVSLYDDEECWLEDFSVLSADGDRLLLDGDARGATGATIGFGFVEEYEDFSYEDWAITATAFVTGEDGAVVGSPSGVQLQYDDYSGSFLANGPVVGVAPGDFPLGDYTVYATDVDGKRSELGVVDGPDPLDLWDTWPDLTVGYVPISLSEDLEVSWQPAPPSDLPTLLTIEMVVNDMDTPHPNRSTQVARLVSLVDDQAGSFSISTDFLAALPESPNQWNEMDEATGYWAEMTITRHQLRKVKVSDGELVMDFIHAISGPVFLEP